MLSLQSTNRVTFNVNVFGTAATPSVRCIVGETPALSFNALKLKGNEYEVLIDLPLDMKSGAQPFKVEVVLNGRLFTPIQTSIDVQAPSPVEGPVVAASAIIPPAVAPTKHASEPAPAPKKTASLDLLASLIPPRIDAEVTPREQLPEARATELSSMAKPVRKLKLTKVEGAATSELVLPAVPNMEGLSTIAKAPAKKLAPRKQAPAPAQTEIKVSMLEVANEAAKTESPAPKVRAKSRSLVAEQKSIPVRLIKGDIIYQ